MGHSQEEMGPLCEKVIDQTRVSKSDAIRPSDALGVGQRWRGQFHESRWPFRFEAGHQLVAGILGASLVSQRIKEQKAYQVPSWLGFRTLLNLKKKKVGTT